jgi:predicted transcriptional regulator
MRYRRRLEIIVDVLNVASKRAKKTRIMYMANLSYRLLEKYLREVAELGFVNSIGDLYEVTEKGRNFLEKYNSFSSSYDQICGEYRKMMFERENLEKLCKITTNKGARSDSRRRRSA